MPRVEFAPSMRQIDDDYIRSLKPDALRGLPLRRLADLRDARERLNPEPKQLATAEQSDTLGAGKLLQPDL
ncbi:MAG: hypothetical protein WBQ37_09815 [Candidatus Competibacter sp.]